MDRLHKRQEQARYHQLVCLAERYKRCEDDAPSASLSEGDLTQFEYTVFSQNGEDGVICELLCRLGEGDRSFVEFGTQTGVESNCMFLAEVRGWSGLFMEGGDDYDVLAHRWRGCPRIRTRRTLVTPENINTLLDEEGASAEPTDFSIDIDGNDYYVWQALDRKPRIVIIEYNAALPLDPDERLVQPYSNSIRCTGTDFFGASLGALEDLGVKKGYTLTHTDITGVNAFFVRDDLVDSLPTGKLVPRRAANYQFSGHGHPADERGLESYIRH